MEQSRSAEVNISSARKGTFCLLWNPKVYFNILHNIKQNSIIFQFLFSQLVYKHIKIEFNCVKLLPCDFHLLDLTMADDRHPRRYAVRGPTLNLSAVTGNTSLATASAPAVTERQSATSSSEKLGQGSCAR